MTQEVLWEGVADTTGYGVATRGYLRVLHRLQWKVQWRALRQDQLERVGLAKPDYDLYSAMMQTEISPRAPHIQHQLSCLFQSGDPAIYRVGCSVFEGYSVPPVWAAGVRRVSELWVPSQFARNAFASSGVADQKIIVIPHFVDPLVFKPGLPQLKLRTSSPRPYRFLSIFELQARKHWKVLLRSWWLETKPTDETELVILVYKRNGRGRKLQTDIVETIQAYKRETGIVREHAPVYFYGCDVPEALMPNLYSSVNAYVGVSCEGFGLPFAEAAACELPIIAPEQSGVQEFLDPNSAFWVPEEAKAPITDPEFVALNPTYRDIKWPHYSEDALRAQLRILLDNRKTLGIQKGKEARKNVLRLLCHERIGRLIQERSKQW